MEINFLNGHTNEAANFKLDTLLQLFPEGDFKFLRNKCIELAEDDSAFETFVNDALTTSGVPMRQEETADHEETDLVAVSFDVEFFLEKCPDPFAYFDTLQRTDIHKTQTFEFLKDRFRDVKSSFIEHIMVEKDYNLLRAAEFLVHNTPPHAIRLEPRQDLEINLSLPWDQNLQKEVLLLDHREEIEAYIQLQEEIKKTAIEEREIGNFQGQVLECECCYSDDILPSDAVMCTEAHIFCKDCIKRSTEVRIGDGLVTFPCLQDCASGGVIPIESIKTVLDSKTYNKVVARIQEEEVKKADIPGIEYCQRCEYAAVPDENIIIFKCAKCHFELCRLCEKESHVPRKCGESVLDDVQKQQRKKEEEFQTTKVLRRCGGCRKPYVKISGCDKVTCSCGTVNCYRCGASGIDYPHIDNCRSAALDPMPGP